MILRYYDLSDVFGAAPKYFAHEPDDFGDGATSNMFPHDRTLQAGGGGGFGGSFSIPSGPINISAPTSVPNPGFQSMSPAASVTLDAIVEVIDSVIENSEFGKQKRSIEQLGNGLLVYAPEEVHLQITDLFELFRQQWGNLRTVSVVAYWIQADPKQVDTLLSEPNSKTAQASLGVGVIADLVWRPFFDQAVTDGRIPYSAALSMHNGQTAHIQSGARPVYVTMASPQELEMSSASDIPLYAYAIKIRQLPLGSTLQLTASTSRGGNFVVLDVHNRINEMRGTNSDESNSAPGVSERALPSADALGQVAIVETRRSAGGNDGGPPPSMVQLPEPLPPRELAAAVDRPRYETYRLSTTVRCPKDQIVLIGGLDGIGMEANKNVYLFARVSVYDVVLDDARPATTEPANPERR
jgi:hypothetical protein